MREAQPHARIQLVEGLDQRRHEFEFQDLVADDVQAVFPAAGHLPHALRKPADILRQPRSFVRQ
ncbi:hypothetical protein [Achromobacter animicus]|uniref:hypothetical protein n=1 Tax=Achromobacter animicus TaxID=1389935 RepID=UPI0039185752